MDKSVKAKKFEAIVLVVEICDYLEIGSDKTLDVIKAIIDSETIPKWKASFPNKPEVVPVERPPIPKYSLCVDSSWIHSFGYDRKRRKLTMETLAGDLYIYEEVPENLWNMLVADIESGDSPGMFYNQWIRGVYPRKK